jgi:hypothetical protein
VNLDQFTYRSLRKATDVPKSTRSDKMEQIIFFDVISAG